MVELSEAQENTIRRVLKANSNGLMFSPVLAPYGQAATELAEMALVRSEPTPLGGRVYELTPAGRAWLAEKEKNNAQR
jgi:hypothetical protein